MSDQMTAGELRKRLENYPDDARIFMEARNAYNRGNSLWAQELLDTYSCDDITRKKKAVMLVGSVR